MKPQFEIIAEIGLQHDGSVKLAELLIDQCRDAEAGAVKVQFFTARDLSGRTKNGWSALKRYALSAEEVLYLSRYARRRHLKFGVSFFGTDGFKNLQPRLKHLDFVKIPATLSFNAALCGLIDCATWRKGLGAAQPRVIASVYDAVWHGTHSETYRQQ